MDEYVQDIQIDSWAIFEKIDLTKREGKPVYKIMDLQGTYVSSHSVGINTNYFLRKNIINTRDDVVYLGFYSYVGEYYDIGKMIDRPQIKSDLKPETNDLIYMSTTILLNESVKFNR